MSGPGLEAAHGVNAARTRRRTLSARGNDGMRDGFFLLLFSRPRPCQRHDPFPHPRPCGDAYRRMADARPCSSADRAPDSGSGCRVRIGSGALRGRRPMAGRPVRNGKVAGSNPAGSTTCGMPPRGSADIPRNDVTSRRRAPPRWNTQTAASRRPRARRREAGPSTGRPHKPGVMGPDPAPATRMWCSGSTPASQAGDRGFESRHPLYPGALVFDVFHPPIPCRGPRRRTDARRGPPIRAVRPFSSAVRTADF